MEADFEAIIRSVINACANCDTCRFLINEDCLFFPELYRLVDRKKESGQAAPYHELKELVELCTLCGLCPCPNIRNDIIKAKAALVKQNGMPLGNRLLADVQKFGRTCGMVPGLTNAVLSNSSVKEGVKRIAGIHKVFVPAQQCCGMPNLVEGDFRTTLKRAKSNLCSILTAKDRGFEPVS